MNTAKAEQPDLSALMEDIVDKAPKNVTFHAELVANPKMVLTPCGQDLPQGADVEVGEDDTAKWYFVIPTAPS